MAPSRSARLSLLLTPLLAASAALCQTPAGTLPAGTPLPLRIDVRVPLRIGQAIHAHTLYPAYADNQVLLPANTAVEGHIIALRPDHARRVRARFGLDFTRFSTPVVQFDRMVLPGGSSLALPAAIASEGAPIYRIVATPPASGGFLHRQFAMGLQIVREDAAQVLGPGKGDRLRQLLIAQLPYHAQRIEKDTSWTIETAAPLDLPAQPGPAPVAAAIPAPRPHWWLPQPPAPPRPNDDPETWILQADLTEPLDSASTRMGTPVQAVVAEPVYNPDHSIAVPQGAKLLGAVTEVRPARSFGRTGILRFDIRQIQLPNAAPRNVQATLTGADSTSGELALDSEGTARPRPQDKISVPLILGFFALETLDGGREHHGEGFRHNVQGANGIGFLGNIAGIAGRTNVAAGIGAYGTLLAIYDRWIAHGKEVAFAKDTRVVVQTTARRTTAIKPDVSPTQ